MSTNHIDIEIQLGILVGDSQEYMRFWRRQTKGRYGGYWKIIRNPITFHGCVQVTSRYYMNQKRKEAIRKHQRISSVQRYHRPMWATWHWFWRIPIYMEQQIRNPDNIQQRLDCAFANEEWRMLYPFHKANHLHRIWYDHAGLLITFDVARQEQHRGYKKLLRFEEAWTKERRCEEIVKEAWAGESHFLQNWGILRRNHILVMLSYLSSKLSLRQEI